MRCSSAAVQFRRDGRLSELAANFVMLQTSLPHLLNRNVISKQAPVCPPTNVPTATTRLLEQRLQGRSLVRHINDVSCQALSAALGQTPKGKRAKLGAAEVKEAHKVFDEVVITVRAGDGGQGEIIESGRGRWVQNLKYHSGGNQPKKLWLPASEPADGADGANVVLVCDPSFDNLLHLHGRKQYTGNKGSNGNPSAGSGGPKKNKDIKKSLTSPFEIPVPPGTVVKRKGTGALLGELIKPGDRLVVAHGGRGGTGVVVPSRQARLDKRDKALRRAEESGAEVIDVEDVNWKQDALGQPGQQVSLNLLLRVVADVGIVGFPNAGKSSLLRSMTHASPEIAPYPFTTLMPNLGVLSSGGPNKTVLADLPGLIEGAHEGKGLGRMFLRHLRRTRGLLHVVDASSPDPATDYYAVREELRMYNPDYVSRPHVVVLNKIDLLGDSAAVQGAIRAVMTAAAKHCTEWSGEQVKPLPPAAIVATSAATGEGLPELNKALAYSMKPNVVKDLAEKGGAATMVLLPVLLAGADAGNEGATAEQSSEEASSGQLLQFYNSKVQGEDAWAGTRIDGPDPSMRSGQGVSDGDAEEDDEELFEIDPADAWLFELTDQQLVKLVEGDERKFQKREKAAAAAGMDPYAGITEDPNGMYVSSSSQAHGDDKASGISSSAGSELLLQSAPIAVAAAAATASVKTAVTIGSDAASTKEQASPDSSSSATTDEADEDEDEWVEISQEDLELLEWLDKYEAEEARKAAEADAATLAPQEGEVEMETDQEVLKENAWLFQMSESDLEALADDSEADSFGGDGSSSLQEVGLMAGSSGQSNGEESAVDPEDAHLFDMSEEQLLELAEKADEEWEQSVSKQ